MARGPQHIPDTRHTGADATGVPSARPPEDPEADRLAAAIGSAVRAARRETGLTVQALAAKAALSQPFLSQVENGRSMPSVLTLHRLAGVLGTSAHALLAQGEESQVTLVRREEGPSHQLSPGARIRLLSGGRREIGVSEVTAQPRARADQLTQHEGDEVVYVLAGEVVLAVATEEYTLRAGDSLHYPADLAHRWRNDSAQPVRMLIVGCPATF